MGQPNYVFNSVIETHGEDPQFVTCYNDTGSTIANGAIKTLSPKWVTGKGVFMCLAAPATNDADSNIIGVVYNAGSTGILDGKFGQVQVKGFIDLDNVGVGTGTVAANDFLEVIDAGTTFIDQGTNGGTVVKTEACAICVNVVDATHAGIYLFGKPSSIKAS